MGDGTRCSIWDDTSSFYSTAADSYLACPDCTWLGLRLRPLTVWDGEKIVEVFPAWHASPDFERKRAAVIGLRIEGLEI